jgi:hypothetical protein
MATAKKVTYDTYDTSDVVLTLSSDEAIAVKTILGSVTGNNLLRIALDEVYYALKGAGVESIDGAFMPISVNSMIEKKIEPGFHNYKG